MTKTWRGVLIELHSLHETRRTMAHASIYHGMYEEKAIQLNHELLCMTGRNYNQFSKEEIETAMVELKFGLEEECMSKKIELMSVKQFGDKLRLKEKTSYEEWLEKLAKLRNTTPQNLEEVYGDMPRDMYDQGDSVERAAWFLAGDDMEYGIITKDEFAKLGPCPQ